MILYTSHKSSTEAICFEISSDVESYFCHTLCVCVCVCVWKSCIIPSSRLLTSSQSQPSKYVFILEILATKVEKMKSEEIKVKEKWRSPSPCYHGCFSLTTRNGGRLKVLKGNVATKSTSLMYAPNHFLPSFFPCCSSFLCYHGWSRQNTLSLFTLRTWMRRNGEKETEWEKWESWGGGDCVCLLGIHYCIAASLELDCNFWGFMVMEVFPIHVGHIRLADVCPFSFCGCSVFRHFAQYFQVNRKPLFDSEVVFS